MKVMSLQERTSCANDNSEMDESLFAHIHLDASLLGSFLEGNTFSNTTDYILKTLEHFSKKGFDFNSNSLNSDKIKQVIHTVKGKFEDLSETDELLKTLPQKYSQSFSPYPLSYIEAEIIDQARFLVEKLEKKKSLMIAGGWNGVPGSSGHAMAYEFIKNGDGSYTFIVFNTGAGIDHHQGMGKFKNKYSPLKVFSIPKNVSTEEMAHFIAALIEPKIKPKIDKIEDRSIDWTAAKTYDADRVYEENIASIFRLGGSEIDPKTLSPMTTQGQLSGTCSMRVLMPLLRMGMQGDNNSGEAFRHYLYQLRIQSIIDFYRIQEKNKILSEPRTQYLLDQAIAKLIRTTRRYMKRFKQHAPILTELQGKAYLEMLDELNIRLKNAKPTSEEVKVNFEVSKSIEAVTYKQPYIPGFHPQNKEKQDQSLKKEYEEALPSSEKFKNVAEYFRSCYTHLQHLDAQGKSVKILKDITDLFKQFPLDIQFLRKYLSEVNSDEAKEIIDLLHKVQKMYGRHCQYASPYPNIQQILTTQTLSLLATLVGEQYFKGKYLAQNPLQDKNSINLPLSNLSFLLPKSLNLNELVTLSRDPFWDDRFQKLEKLQQELGADPQEGLDQMDEQFLNEYLSKETQEALLSPGLKTKNVGADDYDTKRLKLYELASGKLKTTSQPLLSAIKDYDLLLELEQLRTQSRAFDAASYTPFLRDPPPRNQTVEFTKTDHSMDLAESKKSFYLYHHKELRHGIDFDIQSYLFSANDKMVKPAFYNTDNQYFVNLFSNYVLLRSMGTDCPSDLQFTRLSPEGRPIATLDYFSTHYEHLAQKGYQTLFLINFFSPGALALQLTRRPEYVNSILTFIKKGFQFHIQEEEITPGAIFLVYFSGLLLTYLKEHPNASKFSAHIKELSSLALESSESASKMLQVHYQARVGSKESITQNMNDLSMAQSFLLAKHSPKELSQAALKRVFKSMLKFKSQANRGNQSVYFYDDFKDQLIALNPLFKKTLLDLDINTRKGLAEEIIRENLVPDLIAKNEDYTVELNEFQMSIVRKDKPMLRVDLSSGEITTLFGKTQFIPQDFYQENFIKLFGEDSILGFVEDSDDEINAEFEYPPPSQDSTKPSRQYHVTFNKKNKKISMYAELGQPPQWFEFIDPPVGVNVPGIVNRLQMDDTHRVWWKQSIKNRIDEQCKEWFCTDLEGNYKLRIEIRQNIKPDIATDNLPYVCEELEYSGKPTGYNVCSTENIKLELEKYLSRIDDSDNIEVYQLKNEKAWRETFGKENADQILYKIRYPIYGLEFHGRKNKEGIIEFNWAQDPNYKLLPETGPLFGDFRHCLYLMNAKGEKIALVPKKEFYATKKSKESISIHPKLRYDVENRIDKDYIQSMTTMTQSLQPLNSGQYYQFKIEEHGKVTAFSPVDYLGLAYLSLGSYDPSRAMECLRACGKIKGTYEEIEMLMKIIAQIPNLDFKDDEPHPKNIRAMDPDTTAVRLYAASLLAEQQQISLGTPLFSLEKSATAQLSSVNQALLNSNYNKVIDYYQTGFKEDCRKFHHDYFRRFGNVSSELQVPPVSELSVMRLHYGSKDKIESIVLQNRWQELENTLLVKEKRELLKRRVQEKLLNPQDSLRLESIQHKLKEKQNVSVAVGALEQSQTTVPFPSFSFYEDIHSFRQRGFRKKELTVDDLNATVPIQEFLYNFDELYEMARVMPEKYKESKKDAEWLEDKKRLKVYIDKVLRSHQKNSQLGRNTRKETLLGVEACRLLAYVLEYPNENWRRFPYSFDREFKTNLNTLKKIFEKNDKKVLLSVTQLKTKVVTSVKEKKDKEKKAKLDQPALEPAIKPMPLPKDSSFELSQELSIEPMLEALNKVSRPPSPEPDLFEAEEKREADPFLQSQERKFKADLKAGKEKNLLRERRAKTFFQYLAEGQERHKIKLSLQARYDSTAKELKSQREALIHFANLALTGEKASLDTRLGIQGKQIQALKFNDLMGLYLQGDRLELKKRSRLSDKDAEQLYQLIHHFLILETENQQRKRAIDSATKLESLSKESSEFEQEILKLGEEITAKKSYKPSEHPEMLVFEYYENIMIRPEQADLLSRLTSKNAEGSFTSEVIQLIMGGGKSKVLLPLLALKKAQGNNLSVIEVPAALFETNLADLQATTERLFGKQGYPFVFDRNTPASTEHLNNVFEMLDKQVRVGRQYIITTAETIQSLELKYLEVLQAKSVDESQVLAFEKILGLIRNGDALIDECDTVLDPKNELNYTLGQKIPVPQYIFTTIQKLYRLFDKIPVQVLEEKSDLKQVMLGKITVTDDKQWDEIFKKLAAAIVTLPESPLSDSLKSLSLKTNDEALLIQYLNNEAKEMPAFIKTLSEADQKIVDLAKGEIGLFKTGLRRKPNENYGFPKSVDFTGSKHLAIPYLANNTPNERAEFGSVYEIVNYTLQLQKQKDLLSFDLISKFIADFKTQAKQAVADSQHQLTSEMTEAAKKFKQLTGIELSNIHLEDEKKLKELQAVFSKNEDVSDFILLNYVLSGIYQYPKILRSNGINHVSQYRSVQAVTGTPWNTGCYHPSLTFDEQLSLGTDGQTISLLLKKNPNIDLLSGTDPDHIIKQSLEGSKGDLVKALIDAGALFNGIDNRHVAEKIARHLGVRAGNQVKYVLFFNEQNELAALPFEGLTLGEPILIGSTNPEEIAKKTKNSTPSQRFTYYDQRHTTGVDIKQDQAAQGELSIDANTKIRDVCQSALRLRQLAGNQTLAVTLPKALASSIESKKPLTIAEIVTFTHKNQQKILAEAHLVAAIDNMDNVIRKDLLDRIFHAKTVEEKTKLRTLFDKVFTQDATVDPSKQFGFVESYETTINILEKKKKDFLERYERLTKAAQLYSENNFKAIGAQLSSIQEQALKKCLEGYQHLPSRDEGLTVLAQRQKDLKKDINKDKEMDRQIQAKARTEVFGFDPRWQKLPDKLSKDDRKMTSLNEMLKTAANVPWRFSDNIFVTTKFANTIKGQDDLLGQYLKPINFFLLMRDPEGKLNLLIATTEEIEFFSQQLDAHKETLEKQGYHYWITSPSGSVMNGSSLKIDHEEYSALLEQVKFLNVDLKFIEEQDKLEWLLAGFDQKMAFLEQQLLPKYPDRRKFLNTVKEAYKKEMSKRLVSTPFDIETVYTSIKEGDIKQFKEQLEKLHLIKNQYVEEAFLNQGSKTETLPLLSFAIMHKNPDIVKILLQEKLFDDPTSEQSAFKTALQHYEPNIYEALLSEERFFPPFKDTKTWLELISRELNSKDPNRIKPFMNKIASTINSHTTNPETIDIIRAMMKNLIENQINELRNSPQELGRVISALSDASVWVGWVQHWDNSLEIILEEYSDQDIVRLLSHWRKDLAPELSSLRYYLSEYALPKITEKNPGLLQKIVALPEFKPQSLEEWESLLKSAKLNMAAAAPVFSMLKELQEKERSELSHWENFERLAKGCFAAPWSASEKQEYLEKRHLYYPLLSLYPPIDKPKQWTEFMKGAIRDNKEVLDDIIQALLKRPSTEVEQVKHYVMKSVITEGDFEQVKNYIAKGFKIPEMEDNEIVQMIRDKIVHLEYYHDNIESWQKLGILKIQHMLLILDYAQYTSKTEIKEKMQALAHTQLRMALEANDTESFAKLLKLGANPVEAYKPKTKTDSEQKQSRDMQAGNAESNGQTLKPVTFSKAAQATQAVQDQALSTSINTNTAEETLLMQAVRQQNPMIVKLLLEKNCIPVDAVNSKGETALQLAKDLKASEIIELLTQYSTKPTTTPSTTPRNT